ncbi:helix-turn-helix domain-containing protein [bacterium]|nr:helix-turn-helix domain-containing protein [bacterium]
MSDIYRRIKERREELGLTQEDLAIRMGYKSKSSINKIEMGKNDIPQSKVVAFAKALQTTTAYLMGVDEAKEASTIPPGFEPLPEMESVPLVGRIACGQPITAEENLEGYVSIPAAWHATFTLMCKGDSMEPRIKDGDLVAIRSQPSVENGEIAAVRIDCEATLKHVYLYPDKIVLQPENPRYEPIVKIGEEMNDVTIEGKAVGLCRGL